MSQVPFFKHTPARSFFCAAGIFALFFLGTPMMVTQTEALPVFSHWRNQPAPSGNPIRVQYFLDGSLYQETIDICVFKLQQIEKSPLTGW